MFGNNKKQYINILQQDKQLKLDYQIIQDAKILKKEQSSFLITDEAMPDDALFKLDTLQKDISQTYLASLFEGENQKIIPSSDVDVIAYESVNITDDLSIIIPKNEVSTSARYFTNSGIDYIISPFSILHEYVQEKGTKNSLNVLIYNNVVYVMVLNDLKQIVSSNVKELTPFDQIQDQSFSDDIVGQKLYEEVHFLEIQQFLSDVVQSHYSDNEDVEFLEKVEILYTLRPLSDEQIESLYETIMVEIDYKQIDVNEYLNMLTSKADSFKYSFTPLRIKKKPPGTPMWMILVLVSVIAVAAVMYYKMNENNEQVEMAKDKNEEPIKKVVKIEPKEEPKVALPNHLTVNNHTQQNIYMLFDVVPYDGVLKDLEITKSSSTYVANFITGSKSLEDMQSKLKNIYIESKVLLKHNNKAIQNTIVENNSIISKDKMMQEKLYPKLKFLSSASATQYLKDNIKNIEDIKYNAKSIKEFTTYNFTLKTLVKTPKDFFDILEKINKQQYSVTLEYPVVFAKINSGLEVKYNLNLNQINKKGIVPKK